MNGINRSYHAIVWKEGKWYVSKAVEIEVASQGKTRKQALKNLSEAIDLLMEEENNASFKIPLLKSVELHQLSLPVAHYA